MSKSGLADGFLKTFEAVATTSPQPVREHRFHDERKWRFDFAWVRHKVAVEIEGGIFVGGRHGRGATFTMDCEKYNTATCEGWRVLRYTTKDLEQRPVQCVEEVAWLLSVVPVEQVT